MLTRSISAVVCAALLCGCATTGEFKQQRASYQASRIMPGEAVGQYKITDEAADRILKLDPENISQDEVKNILKHAPAPRLISIGGGVYTAHILMINFAKFLVAMGYPEESVRLPADGEYSYSSYFSSRKIAGAIGWFYEREGIPVLLVGHSLGGVQIVKVLHHLSAGFDSDTEVWNPVTKKPEGRSLITDPVSGKQKRLQDLQPVQFATAVSTGGISHIFPQQWSLGEKLHQIPDSARRFTGYYILGDWLGGEWGGESANHFTSMSGKSIRNVALPEGYSHVTLVRLDHLSKNKESFEWIASYRPDLRPEAPQGIHEENIELAADIWFEVKRAWCIAAQNLIRQQRLQGGKING